MKYFCKNCGSYIGEIKNEHEYSFTGKKVFVSNSIAVTKCKDCKCETTINLKINSCIWYNKEKWIREGAATLRSQKWAIF